MGMLDNMSGSIYLWLAIAILVFWCVGLYNRVNRMRDRAIAAFGSLEKHLKTYDVLLRSLVGVTVANGDWAALLHKVQALQLAGKAARLALLQPQPLADLAMAIDAVLAEWHLISSVPADLAGSPIPEAMRIQWEDASARVQSTRAALNQIMLRYNDSLRQFPARLVVGILGFKTAGCL
jgi:LemA protein